MPSKKQTPTPKPGADVPKLKKQAGAAQFQSVGQSSNRAVIYGTAVDFSVDYTPSDRVEMTKRLRYGERNCGLIRQILGDYVTYVVGDGITVQSHCLDAKKADLYEEYFKEACKSLSHCGRFSFTEIQRIITRGALRDGDSFALLVNDPQDGKPKLQLVEGHRVGNPDGQAIPAGMLDGVTFDTLGRIKSYNILQGDKSSREVPASSICQVCEYDYSSGSRGLPLLQHSWTDIQSEDELLKLEMLACKQDTDVTRVLKKTGGFIPSDLASELSGGNGSLDAVASRMGGKLLALEPGEDLVSLESKRPNGNFVKFLEAVQRDIARGTGLPYEFSGDPTAAGGSAMRLIAAKADRSFQRWQTILCDRLCTPTFLWVVGTAIANGDLPDSPDWFKVSWTTPKKITVDAGRDAAQERADIELGLLSLSEAYSARGLDFKQEAQKRAQDFKFIMALAEKEGIPLWTLYKPGFNWLQEGEGKPTASEVQLQQMDAGQTKPGQA